LRAYGIGSRAFKGIVKKEVTPREKFHALVQARIARKGNGTGRADISRILLCHYEAFQLVESHC
jgi:hypothetical protein